MKLYPNRDIFGAKRVTLPADPPLAEQTSIDKEAAADEDAQKSIAVQIAQADQEIQSCYLAIGTAYAEKHKTDYEPAFSSWFEAIGKAEDEKRTCEKQLLALKGLVLCEGCNAEVPQNARYCWSCGKRVAEQRTEIPEGHIQCSRCGSIQKGDARFCMDCGAALTQDAPALPHVDSGEDTAIPAAKTAAGPATAPVIEPAAELSAQKTPEATKRVCPVCHTEVNEGAFFCGECGAILDKSAFVSEPPVQAKPDALQAHCPACGAAIENDTIYCPECGTKV